MQFPVSALLAWSAVVAAQVPVCAEFLDLERFKELREEERYYYEVAEKAFKTGKMTAAINEYSKFLKLYPNIPASSLAQYMLGVCHEQNMYVHTAIKRYQDVLDYYGTSPEAPKAQFGIARCYAKIGEPDKEVQEYQKLLKDFPKDPLAADTLWLLSERDIGAGKPADAADKRKRIVTEFEKHPLYQPSVEWMIRHYLFNENDPLSARQMCLRLRSQSDTELHLAALYREQAMSLLGAQQVAAGKEAMQKAIDIYREFTVKFPKLRDKLPDCEFAIADCQVAMGDYKSAVKTYQEFPDRHPWATRHFKTCVLKIVGIYKGQKMPDMVRQWYRLYLNKWPADDPIRKEFGLYLELIKAWSDARDEYRAMQNKMDGQWEVASSFHREGNAEKAIQEYMVVINSGDFLRINLAFYQVGQVHQHLTHDYEKAIKAYQDSNHEPPTQMFRIAECYVASQKWERAIETCREIINFFKNHRIPAMQFLVTDVYERRKSAALDDTKNAINTLSAMCDLFPDTAASSWAHQKLEDYGVVKTGGGVAKKKEE
jgi:TolA-binding protein